MRATLAWIPDLPFGFTLSDLLLAPD